MFVTPKHSGRSSLGGRTPLSNTFLGRRSLQPTPKTTPSIATRSARAERILEETDEHIVKELNYPVPVQVQEALRTNLTAASIRLHESGWAWLVVGGSRLLLWRYSAPQLTVQCHQLSLKDGAGWNAELISVCSSASDTQLALLACSCNGHVYYWSNVLRDASVAEEGVVDIGDSVVFSVNSLPGESGCLIATTTSHLFLVSSFTQAGLSIRQLQPPHSVLSGFSRRVSSLFFGSQDGETQEVRRVAVSQRGSSTGLVFILTNTNLQKWAVIVSGEQLLYDVELSPLIKAAVVEDNWMGESAATGDDMSVWIVDMQLSGGSSVAVLFAIHCGGASSAEHGLAIIKTSEDSTPLSVSRLVRLRHSLNFQAGKEALLTEYCLHGAPFSTAIAMCNKNLVLLADSARSAESADFIKFPSPNCILGTGYLGSNLLFFTLHHGILAISQANPSISKSAITTPRHPTLLLPTPTLTPIASPYTTSTLPAPEASSDATEALKNAFSLYLDGNLTAAFTTCEQYFPRESFATGLDTQGDLAVVQLSQMVLDDPPPTADPRWSEGVESPGGASLILIYRLEEKFQAHTRYVQFITDVGMLDRLTCVHMRGRPVSTRLVLCEHTEKIQAAVTLRRMHNLVVDQAIKLVLQNRPPSSHPNLTKNDIFYTHISKLEDIFPALLASQRDTLHSMESPQERVELILNVSSLLDSTLRDAVVYRHSKATLYQVCSQDQESGEPEFVAWTASEGERGIRDCISEQLQVILEVGIQDVQTQKDRSDMWSAYFSLSDLLCDGYTAQLSSLEKLPSMRSRLKEVRKKFEATRQQFLSPLLEYGQLQHVTELAEKYEDFPVLIQLCEKLGNKVKLKEYMSLFASQGFSDFLFKHYLDQGKLHQLLSFSADFPQELAAFLEPHGYLSWLHHISMQDYAQAHRVLHEMAEKEVQYVGKKKTLLSLSKLAALASHERIEKVQVIDDKLKYIAYQQNLPKEAIQTDDGDPATMPPLAPQNIVELYVGENNPNSGVSDFLTALDFIHFFKDDQVDVEELRAYIWSQAVLKDDWTQLSTDDPLGELQKTFFFRIVEEAFKNDVNMLVLLPSLKALLACPQITEVGLHLEPGFQFLMKAGYEQVVRVQSHSTQQEGGVGE